jgi:hypothetical protein
MTGEPVMHSPGPAGATGRGAGRPRCWRRGAAADGASTRDAVNLGTLDSIASRRYLFWLDLFLQSKRNEVVSTPRRLPTGSVA